MRFLVALKQFNSENGFTLLEMIIVVVILGVMAAIGAPSLVASQRQNEANRVFSQIRAALIQAQTNAQRQSTDCTVTITTTSVTAAPSGCILESVSIDNSVIDVSSSGDGTIVFTFEGEIPVGDVQTFQIARKDFSGNAITTTGKCISIPTYMGLIRSGIYDNSASANCRNVENDLYDNL